MRKKRILIVVDMQNNFTTGVLGNKQCLAVVPKVAEIIKNGNYDAMFATRDTHSDNYLITQEGKKSPIPHCRKGSVGWLFHPMIEDALFAYSSIHGVRIIEKDTFGSLYLGKLLEEQFLLEDVQIDFVGVYTGICVISNAMIAKAALPEATIRVLADACACVTPESHKTALEAMKLCQIEIIEEGVVKDD